MLSHINSRIIVLVHDIFMIFLAYVFAYFLYYNLSNHIAMGQILHAIIVIPILLIIQIFFYWHFGLYRGVWRFASIPDLIRIVKAVVSACIVCVMILFFLGLLSAIPRSIFPLYGIILVMLLGGSRLLYRAIKDKGYLGLSGKRVLIIGAGNAGEGLARDLLRDKEHYCVIAFVDDDEKKQGKEIHGVRVAGSIKDISTVVKSYEVDVAIIAIPSATAATMRQLVAECARANIAFQTLPGINDLTNGRVAINSLREVALEDLLGREQVKLDWESIQAGLSGQVVLVSGGGGSIGSELCRQVANLGPRVLIVLENSEFNLYQIGQEITKRFLNLKFVPCLGDVANPLFVQRVFQKYKPDIVFHAAAYKHVPILEDQVYSAIRNNILGTKMLADIAVDSGVKKFILISTDKAVRPSNVMGATKRAAEILCYLKNTQGQTCFITVRFGNVLGSSGSVVPLFKKQLAGGGPLTVTHPEVTRFFMTIPEAARLIMQASVLGEGGEVFVLDMGEPIKISYLAEQMIRLSGKEPDVDIQISYTGLRPGEKLYEELFYKNEEMARTKHKKIFQATHNILNNDDMFNQYEQLFSALDVADEEKLYLSLKQLVPEFNNNEQKDAGCE